MSVLRKKKDRNGYEARFRLPDGSLTSIWLAGSSKREAQTFLASVESIVSRKKQGLAALPEDADWLQSMQGTKLHAKLVDRGLAEERVVRASPTFADWSQQFIDDHQGKESTKEQLRICRRDAVTFFGGTKEIAEITAGDAGNFSRWLHRKGLAEATVRKKCSRVSQFFVDAVRRKIIVSNPFDDVKTAAVSNEMRMVYIEAEKVAALIESIDCGQLKLVLALCRFGGFRRHECMLLEWRDFDWQAKSITVRSNKTPPIRKCPIFADLREHLEAHRRSSGRVVARWEPDSNGPATMLRKHCEREGLDLWDKPFQNLRASKVTDLLDRFPIKDVCSWLGNSPDVAFKHYAMSRNANFAAAAE